MKTKIFYIHGFGSSPQSDTLRKIQKVFPDAIGLTYDANDPVNSVILMRDEIERISAKEACYPTIVGSSLGGWYAEQLTRHVVADFIMYNPATSPETSLVKYGVPQAILYKYRILSGYALYKNPASRTVVLSMDDEVLDAAVVFSKYVEISKIVKTSGGHRMTDQNMKIIIDEIQYLENQLP